MTALGDRLRAPLGFGSAFLVVWSGQTVSLFTMAMTRFALAVWAYQHTGSILRYSLVVVCISLPGVIATPWAGSIVDRNDRRRVMMTVDCVFVAASCLLGLVAVSEDLQLWHVCLTAAVTSVCQAFRLPAYLAAITLLVPKAQLGRANGMVHLAGSLALIAAPVIAAPLLALAGLPWIVTANALGFALSAALLSTIRVPTTAAVPHAAARHAHIGDLRAATACLRTRPGLGLLLIYSSVQSLATMTVLVLFTPMVLARHSQIELGTIMSAGGLGALAGSILMIGLGAPRRLVATMLWVDILFSVAIGLAGLVELTALLCVALFTAMLCEPVFQTCAQTLWQRKIPTDLQGRVFALESALTSGAMPLAALVGGLLADRVFEPAFGSGVGIQVMFVLVGIATAVLGIAAFLWRRFRLLDQDLPDAH